MKTTENNKLIAEFMNLSIKDGVSYYTDEFDMFPMGIEVDDVYLPYDQSWDWLMPVVNKCLNIYHIEQMNDDLNFTFYDAMGNMEETYQAVVEFIKEYNNRAESVIGSFDENGDLI